MITETPPTGLELLASFAAAQRELDEAAIAHADAQREYEFALAALRLAARRIFPDPKEVDHG